MFAPLGIAYIVSIAASLVVALTVTPVLCYYLLGRARAIHDRSGFVARGLAQATLCPAARLRRCGAPASSSAPRWQCWSWRWHWSRLMGREFLPPFNEGTLNINASLTPGTSLAESNRVGALIEAHPARDARGRVDDTTNRPRGTGRARGRREHERDRGRASAERPPARRRAGGGA